MAKIIALMGKIPRYEYSAEPLSCRNPSGQKGRVCCLFHCQLDTLPFSCVRRTSTATGWCVADATRLFRWQYPPFAPYRERATTDPSVCRRRESSPALRDRDSPEGVHRWRTSLSTTSPISSTSKLTAPSSPHDHVDRHLASVRVGHPSRRRKSIAVTICPRRLISPSMTSGAKRNVGHLLVPEDLLHAEHIHAEKTGPSTKNVESSSVGLGRLWFQDRGIGQHDLLLLSGRNRLGILGEPQGMPAGPPTRGRRCHRTLPGSLQIQPSGPRVTGVDWLNRPNPAAESVPTSISRAGPRAGQDRPWAAGPSP